MAPLVLGLGIPHTSKFVPEQAREPVRKQLEAMEADMKSSPYDFEVLYGDPEDMPKIVEKLKEKKWDIVHIGVGVRAGPAPALTAFLEDIVNAAHQEVPGCKFAFCTEIMKTQDACQRVLPA